MELSFNKHGSGYIATATVNAPFNLHIDKDTDGLVELQISSVEGAGYVTKFKKVVGKTLDQDFNALVFPKYLRVIVSPSMPTKGIITEEL